jgi:hypothetical protein
VTRAAIAIIAFGLGGCATLGSSQGNANTGFDTYCEAKAALADLERAAKRTHKQNVSLELSAPYMPSKVDARGAAAMAPPGDLRMILLGPGGATALDLWLHDGRFRFAVPALERTIRGDASTPPEKKRGLPVDFLRWWMLDPFAGELLWAARDDGGLHFVLRDGAAYVDGTIAKDGKVDAVRTTWDASGQKLDTETLSATSVGCGRVEYHQESTQLLVVAKCESESEDVPAKAFADPDEASK